MKRLLFLIATFVLFNDETFGAAPFFFLCHYHGPPQAPDEHLGVGHAEIELSVEIDGNPEYYEPRKPYKVSVMSSSDFDGFMMTGLYTLPETLTKPILPIPGLYPNSALSSFSTPGMGVLCSIVHSHVSQRPKKKVSFLWLAPPTGSGCVQFLATGTLDQQIIFKDTLAFRLCEKGVSSDDFSLTSKHEHGIIFRDDFENSSSTMNELWRDSLGVDVSLDCHPGIRNNVAKFCNKTERILTTLPLNTTMARMVQFTTVSDNCSNGTWNHVQTGFIDFKFGLDQCRNWISIEKIVIPKRTEHKIHIVPLPPSARGKEICLQWLQEEKLESHNCWSLDHILVTNTADLPKLLSENFDPIDPGNFLLFPNGRIIRKCQSDGNALVFHVPRHSVHPIYATTRDFDVTAEFSFDDNLLQQGFDGGHSMDGWILDGGHVSQRCGVVNYKKAAVFVNVNETGPRVHSRLCTPFFDATSSGTLIFYLTFGFTACNVTASKLISSPVIQVYVEFEYGTEIPLREIPFAEYAEPQRVVIPLLRKSWVAKSRFCWRQLPQSKKEKSRKTNLKYSLEVPWAIDSVRLLPWQPSRIQHVLQFKINAACGNTFVSSNDSMNSIIVEFSNDHGISWTPLYSACLPPECNGPQGPFSSTLTSQDYPRWSRVSYPLPYPTLFGPTRIRFQHVGRSGKDWAIDDVFVGYCLEGCFGHGQCVSGSCICDAGYLGSFCNETLSSNPRTFLETFATPKFLPENNRFQIRGGALGYQCGILNKGKALVFDKIERRAFATSELNTTEARYLEFTVRLGSNSKVGGCSGPKEASNGIYVHSSCNGGVKWNLLLQIVPNKDREPRHMFVVLSNVAKGDFCRFLIWQASHSGLHRDVWALDNIAINGDLLNSIHLNFSDVEKVQQTVAQHTGVLGPYCNLQDTMRIGHSSHRTLSSQLIETKPMDIGPSYMLQFELVLHCTGDSVQMNSDSKINLEYSTDHGMTWNLVQKPCLPPSKRCRGLYSQGTEYFASEFKDWKRVTISLSPNTWSQSTKFRFIQSVFKNDGTDESWGIDNIYIGPECSDLCSGHGLCVDGVCICDKKFFGPSCLPKEKMPNSINGKMTSAKLVRKSGFETTGGKVFTEEEQQRECGILASGGALYFTEMGVRQLVTPDLDTHAYDMVQFFLQTGWNKDFFKTSSNGSLSTLTGTTCRNKYVLDSGVIMQFSNDAGNTWYLIKEFADDQHRKPRLESVLLPKAARTNCTRLRWWQPINSVVVDRFAWALDEISFVDQVGGEQPSPTTSFHNTFINNTKNRTTTSVHQESWAFHTTVSNRKYCLSDDPTLVFDGPELHRFAITKEMVVAEGDIIQFQISVGCTDTFSYTSAVQLEYSHDCGMSWTLVEQECYPESSCGIFQEASIYYIGTHGHWTLIVLPVSRQIASNKVSFRWSQQSTMNETTAVGAFALKNVYIGRPCLDWCFGRGFCSFGTCHCDQGYKSPLCTPLRAHPANLADKFDASDVNNPGPLWQAVHGGWLGTGCGSLAMGNTLYFGGNGTREARTVSLDTRWIRNIKFLLRLGWKHEVSTCHIPKERNESLVMQYSVTNGLSWQSLHQFDYRTFDANSEKTESMSSLPKGYVIDLPNEARTAATNFRWWQPLSKASLTDERAPWALDNVVFAADEFRHPESLFEDFTSVAVEHWYRTVNGSIGRYCFGEGNVLYFSNVDELQFAETEDFAVPDGAFLQFNLAVNCQKHSLVSLDSAAASSFALELEYSVDGGHSWNLLIESCSPPHLGCLEYQTSSRYFAEMYHGHWTRITVPVPPRAVSISTRFRWRKTSTSSDMWANLGWALDSIFLGNDCPWMCSGHGECRNKTCSCDDGFEEPHCVPSVPLPCEFREVFDGNISTTRELWLEMYGATIESDYCGSVVSGPALVFDGERGMRMIVTRDLDLLNAMYIQFTLKMGCELMAFNDSGSYAPQSRLHSILLQYSNNGGITWHFLKEVPYVLNRNSTRHIVPLQHVVGVRTNCTRFRFWQPQNSQSEFHFDFTFEWALDSVLVSGFLLPPDVLYDTLDDKDLGPHLNVWLDWPGGHIGTFCDSSGSRNGIVFNAEHGERAAYTKDVHVTAESVVQFDIKVGCGFRSSRRHPVRLEYSTDLGRTWKLVIGVGTDTAFDHGVVSSFDDDLRTANVQTIFYANTEAEWKRVVIPLTGLGICGTVRFCWFQGFYLTNGNADLPIDWSLDNIYVGPACDNHCHGHGACLNGVMCQCDPDHNGTTCERPLKSNPSHLKENFEIKAIARNSEIATASTVAATLRSSFLWRSVSGAEVSNACGTLITGTSLVFNGLGSRHLISQDLNLTLTSAVQFYLRLSCGRSFDTRSRATSIFLHYSTNGGVSWLALEELDFGTDRHMTTFVTVELPEDARTQATMLKWSQPSTDGTFTADWAIDQIYIGGDDYGLLALNDDFEPSHDTNWISTPGALLQPVCGRLSNTLNFAGHDEERFAITAEVLVTDDSYIQFELLMGCRERPSCYTIELEFSLDAGKSWRLVQEKCLISDTGCTNPQEPSVYFSNLYYGYNRVTFMLPHHTSSRGTRFRWIQKPKFEYSQTWALGSVYIGHECRKGCSGRGKCVLGKCKCDDGWNGDTCNIPKEALPVDLREEFEPSVEVSSKRWAIVRGGIVSDLCGSIGSDSALHFYGGCSRLLQTSFMDLRNAVDVRYTFVYGCITPVASRHQNVFLQYSLEAGVKWSTIMEIDYKVYKNKSMITVSLPFRVRQLGVLLRWWQPEHGGRAQNDWAIDNVMIGGGTTAPTIFLDLVNRSSTLSSLWLYSSNVELASFCRSGVIVAVGEVVSGAEDALLETSDIQTSSDSVLEFSLAVGCDSRNESTNIPPVHAQYSIDRGVSWHLVLSECLPENTIGPCGDRVRGGRVGAVGSASIYDAPRMWTRETIPLFGRLVSDSIRFRWIQFASSFDENVATSFTNSFKWGLRDVYIGPGCSNLCHGHGSSRTYPNCSCDDGYEGRHCEIIKNYHVDYLRDSFDKIILEPHWRHFSGSFVNSVLSTADGNAAVMNKCGSRLLETVDLDLQDAKFLHYVAAFEGLVNESICTEKKADSLYLQYSVNGGITWHLLHEIVHLLHVVSQTDYIVLPLEARTASSRFRWWQRRSSCSKLSGKNLESGFWVIDQVLIGGSDINLATIDETFENPQLFLSDNWWFAPGGKIMSGFCYSKSGQAMVWNRSSDHFAADQSITTRELIIGENYVLRFKIVVGCSKSNSCVDNSVLLEHRSDQSLDQWNLVESSCFPANTSTGGFECPLNLYREGSWFTSQMFNQWTQVVISLPIKTISSTTQFRWRFIGNSNADTFTGFGIDDVQIGEACDDDCDPVSRCVATKEDDYCKLHSKPTQPNGLFESFDDDDALEKKWTAIFGGVVSLNGCGSLTPWGHGSYLYFGDCASRQATTRQLDLRFASKLLFVLRIGSSDEQDNCKVNLLSQHLENRSVLLQFSVSRRRTWNLIAIHQPKDFLRPRRLVYDIPFDARQSEVQFRWWQPDHSGQNTDQWALDQIEIII